MRESYLEWPPGSLTDAKSVLIDWNISARLEAIHRQQTTDATVKLPAADRVRLLNLANSMREDAVLITGLSAAESEVRRAPSNPDLIRYESRADLAAFYLSSGRDYLHHLLVGGESGGLQIESIGGSDSTFEALGLHRWVVVPYSALLKAVEIDILMSADPLEKLDRYRFFLERELQVSPSREGWVGFLLLAGRPQSKARARRLLKLDSSSGDLRDRVWGAAWDLLYTRMPSMVESSVFRGRVQLPLTFVTDDAALVDVLRGVTPVATVRNLIGTELTGDQLDFSELLPEAAELLLRYMGREARRINASSRGLTSRRIRRAMSISRQIEARLARAGK